MKQHIPLEKMSKKAQREFVAARRGGWGGISPVTRTPPNPKAYNRKKARREGFPDDGSFAFLRELQSDGPAGCGVLFRLPAFAFFMGNDRMTEKFAIFRNFRYNIGVCENR